MNTVSYYSCHKFCLNFEHTFLEYRRFTYNSNSVCSYQYLTSLLLARSATHTDPLEATATPTGSLNPPIEWI